MAGTSTYDPLLLGTTAKYQLRATLGDTDVTPGKHLFLDEELQWFLDSNGSNLYHAAEAAMLAAAASTAKIAIAIQVLAGTMQVDRQKVSEAFRAAAKAFRERAETEAYSVRQTWEDGDQTWTRNIRNDAAYDFEATTGADD